MYRIFFGPSTLERKWSEFSAQNPDLQPNMYQGDILLADGFNIQGKNALKVEAYKWPKGIIPFIFHEKFRKSSQKR